MGKIVTPITATVEVIGKLKESSYKPGSYYRSVLFLDQSKPGGADEAKIWKSLSEEECEGLVKGATVQLVPTGRDQNGKDKHNIVLADGSHLAPAPQEPGWTPEDKRLLALKVQQHSDLLKYCLELSRNKFAGLVESEDSFRALATTLFLNALRN